MSSISIDASGVPTKHRHDPRFTKMLAMMETELSLPSQIESACVHESGHVSYFRKLGVSEFQYHGPGILYDAQSDQFEGHLAAVEPNREQVMNDSSRLGIALWLVTLAQAYAAGGVFLRELVGNPNGDDHGDRQEFNKIWRTVCERAPLISIPEDMIWVNAEASISRDLKNPAFRKEAWVIANEIRERLFPDFSRTPRI